MQRLRPEACTANNRKYPYQLWGEPYGRIVRWFKETSEQDVDALCKHMLADATPSNKPSACLRDCSPQQALEEARLPGHPGKARHAVGVPTPSITEAEALLASRDTKSNRKQILSNPHS